MRRMTDLIEVALPVACGRSQLPSGTHRGACLEVYLFPDNKATTRREVENSETYGKSRTIQGLLGERRQSLDSGGACGNSLVV